MLQYNIIQISCFVDFQYLFENGSMENIFTHQIFSKFSELLAQTLRAFNPSCTAKESLTFSSHLDI